LIADLEKAAEALRIRDQTDRGTCQLGPPGESCNASAQAQVVDAWGGSPCGCLDHAGDVIVKIAEVFLADRWLAGLAAHLDL
jgi:hypothetical protein